MKEHATVTSNPSSKQCSGSITIVAKQRTTLNATGSVHTGILEDDTDAKIAALTGNDDAVVNGSPCDQ